MDYETIRKNFENHGFATQFFSTREDVKEYFVNTLKRKAVGFGGSATLHELGLFEALQENNAVVWHSKTPSRDTRALANNASVYITSANAVTETGEIVNIDGTGNRVAMTAFGPKNCYYIIGKNKITKNISEATYRAKNIAAPKNAHRLNLNTPCAIMGDRCYNCNEPERICRMTIVIDRAPFGMQSEVVFVDQDLGF